MTDNRIERMKEVVARFPEDPRARYFLAHELLRSEQWAQSAEQYEAYLRLVPGDEGTGYKNYGRCLAQLGRAGEAAEAFRQGINRALAHRHDALAAEIRDLLDSLEG